MPSQVLVLHRIPVTHFSPGGAPLRLIRDGTCVRYFNQSYIRDISSFFLFIWDSAASWTGHPGGRTPRQRAKFHCKAPFDVTRPRYQTCRSQTTRWDPTACLLLAKWTPSVQTLANFNLWKTYESRPLHTLNSPALKFSDIRLYIQPSINKNLTWVKLWLFFLFDLGDKLEAWINTTTICTNTWVFTFNLNQW